MFPKALTLRSVVALSLGVSLLQANEIAASQQREHNITASHNTAKVSDTASKLIPILSLLVAEDSTFRLRVGRTNTTTYPAKQHVDGLTFTYRPLTETVDVSLTITGLNATNEASLWINGVQVRQLRNGVNTFSIPASSEPNFEIKFAGNLDGLLVGDIQTLLRNGPRSRAEAQLFLMRATFGPTLSELDYLMEVGYATWVDEQLNLPQTKITPLFDQALIDRAAARRQELIAEGVTDPEELDRRSFVGASQQYNSRMDAWWDVTLNGRDQLRQRVIYALSQIMVTSEIEGSGRPLTTALYHDVLGANAFSNYFDLLKNVTLSPTMGLYLDFAGNQRARDGREPDENYAREIMQLFSIGLVELNLDGTEKLVNGKAVETYDQNIVRSLARVFTGWHIIGGRFSTPDWERSPLERWGERQTFHDFNEKSLLRGHVNPAGLSTEEDLDLALRNIFEHPNVAPFFSTRLIERLVTTNPSADYVRRVATIFNDNGEGVRGDLAAVIRAILLDPEALNSADNRVSGGKLKEPILRASQLFRAFSARSDIDYFRFTLTGRPLGQKPFAPATVFNFYEPSYAPEGPISAAGLRAPEFKIITDNQILEYLYVLHQLATSTSVGNDTGPFITDFRRGIQLNIAEPKALAMNSDTLLDYFNERLFGGMMSPGLREIVIEHVDALSASGTVDQQADRRVEEALSLLITSPEYALQR